MSRTQVLFLFFVGLCIQLFATLSARARATTLELHGVGMSVTLPDVYKLSARYLDAEELRLLDFTNDSLRKPAGMQPSADSNAVAIECPGGLYAIAFVFQQRFPNEIEYFQSVQRQREELARLEGIKPDEALQCSNMATLFDGLNATEISVRRPVRVDKPITPHNIDHFTEIVLIRVGLATYGLVFRSSETAAPMTQTPDRLMMVELLNAVHFGQVARPLRSIQLGSSIATVQVPQAWNIEQKSVSEPPFDGLVAKLASIQENSETHAKDSTPNQISVQLPEFRLDLSVWKLRNTPDSLLSEHIHRYLSGMAGQFQRDAVVDDDYTLGTRHGAHVSAIQLRRGNVIQDYIVLRENDVIIIAHTICWQSDYPLVEPVVRRTLELVEVQKNQ